MCWGFTVGGCSFRRVFAVCLEIQKLTSLPLCPYMSGTRRSGGASGYDVRTKRSKSLEPQGRLHAENWQRLARLAKGLHLSTCVLDFAWRSVNLACSSKGAILAWSAGKSLRLLALVGCETHCLSSSAYRAIGLALDHCMSAADRHGESRRQETLKKTLFANASTCIVVRRHRPKWVWSNVGERHLAPRD
jgi:hypothetical protein